MLPDFVSSGVAVLGGFANGLAERFAGMAAAAATKWEGAEEHFERALDLAETLPHHVDQARVHYWYARMLLSREGAGDLQRAETLLAEARSLSESMGRHLEDCRPIAVSALPSRQSVATTAGKT